MRIRARGKWKVGAVIYWNVQTWPPFALFSLKTIPHWCHCSGEANLWPTVFHFVSLLGFIQQMSPFLKDTTFKTQDSNSKLWSCALKSWMHDCLSLSVNMEDRNEMSWAHVTRFFFLKRKTGHISSSDCRAAGDLRNVIALTTFHTKRSQCSELMRGHICQDHVHCKPLQAEHFTVISVIYVSCLSVWALLLISVLKVTLWTFKKLKWMEV